ncbi:MAG: sigma 54-interacting transcriptional regulator [Myxococcota bacterium]
MAESLLFGHEKGSFTGATAQRTGFFRDSSSGTLFLDELGELSMAIQAKLLRVIQDREVYAVGSSSPSSVDTWLVAATNRDPELEISRGNMRSDFYYRIATLPIQVPSLAERRYDVPLLFVHFLRQRRERHPELERLWAANPSGPAIPMGFIIDLMRRSWPGNIRELQNVVEQTIRQNIHTGPFVAPALPNWAQGMSLSQSSSSQPHGQAYHPSANDTLEYHPTDFPDIAQSSLPPGMAVLDRTTLNDIARELSVSRKMIELLLPKGVPIIANETHDMRLDRIQGLLEDALIGLLAAHEFNQAQVARDLGVARTTIIRIMKRLGIPRPQDLPDEVIAEARQKVGDDLVAMAQHLNVSVRALTFYLSR